MIIWPDAFGLRPAMSTWVSGSPPMAIPSSCRPVLPHGEGPGIEMALQFSEPGRHGETAAADGQHRRGRAAEKDAAAFVAFLDAQKQVNAAKKIGTQVTAWAVRCVRTMAAVPNRLVPADRFTVAARHRSADEPASDDSKMKGRLYVAVASNDDSRQPDAKTSEARHRRECAG